MIIINSTSSKPAYEQIYEALKNQILTGEISAGSKLPATRAFAKDYNISRNTVITAYDQLKSEGFIRSVAGSGYYVEDIPAVIKPAVLYAPSISEPVSKYYPSYDFRYGDIDLNIYRTREFRRCLNNALAEEELQEALRYDGAQGLFRLRRALTIHLHSSRGVNTSPEQIIITGGHHYSLKIITELFPKENFLFAMEEPGYRDTQDVFKHAGYKFYSVPLDNNGIQPELLKNIQSAVLYITPSHQFLMGSVLPIGRRIELLKWASDTNSCIIEDDYDSELRYHEMPIPSLQSIDRDNRVIYLGTFSKSLSPDLRISYAILPQNIKFDYEKRYPFFNAPSPTLIQIAAAEYIESGEYQKHLNSMRTIFRKKHDLILRFMHERFPKDVKLYGVGGGMHFIMEINTPLEQSEIISRFTKNDVGVYPTKVFWNNPSLCPENQVIIGYGAVPLNRLHEHLEAMCKALVNIL